MFGENMTFAQKLEITCYGYAFIATLLAPILAVWLRFRKKENHSWTRPILLSVIISWNLQILYRDLTRTPFSMRAGDDSGINHLLFLGNNGNEELFKWGWTFPLMTCAVFGIFWKIDHALRREKTT